MNPYGGSTEEKSGEAGHVVETPVLVDTSVWVEYLRKPSSTAGKALSALLSVNRVMTSGVIVAEILHGARTRKEREELADALGAIPIVELNFSDWVAIGSLLNDLRLKGHTFALVNIAIAHAARSAGCALFTLDSAHRKIPGITFFNP